MKATEKTKKQNIFYLSKIKLFFFQNFFFISRNWLFFENRQQSNLCARSSKTEKKNIVVLQTGHGGSFGSSVTHNLEVSALNLGHIRCLNTNTGLKLKIMFYQLFNMKFYF